MRCVIARFPFDLTKSEVEQSMEGVSPEPAVGICATVGGRVYPVKQIGQIITGQDRRDFTAAEVSRALTRLGFTCHEAAAARPQEPRESSALPWADSPLG
ncbi:SCO5918 family protein [Streptomyces achromogenes]|uniref:SCO5918 family protein n=1 Tax=Streptomyces achromogenes TaxID=67255 RepID=A0ABZ1KR02_STRAH|nr:SCO5918 family protein [Streptomyces sp. UMAF16]